MKISIIVPTRNRGEYLGYCLKTCLASNDANIEVIVSDNNSSDRSREVVSGITDSRLRYSNTGKSVSMRQNYEFALRQATGEYVMIIGDDDGLLRNGLQTLRFLIEKYNPDIINWRTIDYKWPRTQPVPESGSLKFSSRYFFGPLIQKHPSEIFAALCDAKTLQYREGANLYHGCVSRRVIDTLRQSTGEYFQAQAPDVYASIANLSVAKSHLWIGNPITIGGESEKSHGAAMANRETQNTRQANVSADFSALSDADPVIAEINMKVRVIIAYTYAVLNRVNQLLYGGRLNINHAGWREAILKEAARLSPELRLENEAILQKYFSDADPKYRPDVLADTTSIAGKIPAPARTAVKKAKRTRGRPIAPRNTETIEAVARWIDAVTGAPHFPAESPAIASLYHLWKMIETEIKVRRAA